MPLFNLLFNEPQNRTVLISHFFPQLTFTESSFLVEPQQKTKKTSSMTINY
jgi:hypothetical protein